MPEQYPKLATAYIGVMIGSFVLAIIFFILYDKNDQKNLAVPGYILLGVFALLAVSGIGYMTYDKWKSGEE